MKSHFELEGHRSWYVTNLLLHIQSLKVLYTLWKKHVISFGELTTPTFLDNPLDAKQRLVLSLFEAMLRKRKEHYDSIDCALDGLSDDSDSEAEQHSDKEQIYNPVSPCSDSQPSEQEPETIVDWRKFLLVVGRAGSGKSYAFTHVYPPIAEFL
jgi:hypothetical protein